jgi:hypothetical protein
MMSILRAANVLAREEASGPVPEDTELKLNHPKKL